MKETISLLLAVIMVLSLFAGCGQESSPAASQPETASEASVTETASEPEAEPEESAAPEEPEAETSAEAIVEETEPEPEHPTLSYPIADGDVTFKMLQVYNPNASAVYGNTGDYSSAYTYQTLAEATGVNIEFKMLSEASFSSQIDLIIASGDTPDFYGRSLGSYDSKLQAAVEEEVVIDILPLLEENAPDLWALMEADPDWKTKLTNNDGTLCKIANYTLPKTCDGPFIRGDWLKELNLEAPTNLKELTAVLEAFKSEYNCSLTLLLDSDLGSVLDQCFNTGALSATRAKHRVSHITAENNYELGMVENLLCPAVNNGVVASFDGQSVWTVDKTCYLTGLTLEPGAVIRAPEGKTLTMTVDGVPVEPKPGTYKGSIVMTLA